MSQGPDSRARATRKPLSGRVRATFPDVLVASAIVVQGAVCFYYARDVWFGVDALHYFAQRGTIADDSVGIFEPYAGHWISALLVLYRAMFELVGLRHYLPFAGMAIAVHLSIVALSYRVLLRSGIGRWTAAVACVLLATFGAGSEAYLFDSPLALTGAVVLGLFAIATLLKNDFNRRARTRAALALLVGVMFSITGVVMAVVVTALVAFLRGPRSAAIVVAPAATAFTWWLAVYGRHADRIQASGEQLLQIPALAWSLLTTPLGSLLPLPGAGPAMTLGVLVALTLFRPGNELEMRAAALAWAAMIGALAQAALSGLASAHANPEAVLVGRYQYVIAVLLLPAVALIAYRVVLRVGASWDLRWLQGPVLALVMLGVLVTASAAQWKGHLFYKAESELFRSMFVGTFAATAAGERVLTRDLEGHFMRADDMAKIAGSDVGGELPPIFPTDSQRLEAEGAFFVGVGEESWNLPGPSDMRSDSFGMVRWDRFGCKSVQADTFSPVISFSNFEGAQISVQSAAGSVTTTLSRDGVSSQPRTWPLDPERVAFIGTTAELATLELTFDAGGQYRICRA